MTGNTISAIICLVMGVSFGILALVFALIGRKGAILISGFNSLTKEERAQYDEIRMSKDMRNSLLIWGSLMIISGVLSYFISFYFAIIGSVLWLVLLLKDVKLTPEKAFEKYRL